MTELTSEKIRLVMLAIGQMRLTGELGACESVSPERMARYSQLLGCPLDEKTFRNAEAAALTSVRRALEAMGHGPVTLKQP